MTNDRMDLEDGEIESDDENIGDVPGTSYSNDNGSDEAVIDQIVEASIHNLETEKNEATRKLRSVLLPTKRRRISSRSSQSKKGRNNHEIESKGERKKRIRDRSRSDRSGRIGSPSRPTQKTSKNLAPLTDILCPPPPPPPVLPPVISFTFNGNAILLPPPPPPMKMSCSESYDNCEVVDMDIDEEKSSDEQQEPEDVRIRRELLEAQAEAARENIRRERRKHEEEEAKLKEQSASLQHQHDCISFELENCNVQRLRLLEQFQENELRITRMQKNAVDVLQKKLTVNQALFKVQKKMLQIPNIVPKLLQQPFDQLTKSINDGKKRDEKPANSANSESEACTKTSERKRVIEEEESSEIPKKQNELEVIDERMERELRERCLKSKASKSRSGSEVSEAVSNESLSPSENVDRKKTGRELLLKMCKFDMNGICDRGDLCEFLHLEKGKFDEQLMMETILRNLMDYKEEDIGSATTQMINLRVMKNASLATFVRDFLSHAINGNAMIRNRFYTFFKQG